VVFYRLSIVTVECLRRSNQQVVVGHFEPKVPVAPLGVDP